MRLEILLVLFPRKLSAYLTDKKIKGFFAEARVGLIYYYYPKVPMLTVARIYHTITNNHGSTTSPLAVFLLHQKVA